jgi:heavy metal sensor kinase
LKSTTGSLKGKITFFHSIRFRLLLWFTAILMLVLIVFSTFIYYNQARDLEDDSLGRLERRSARLQETLRISLRQQNGQIVFPEDILEETDAFALISPNGQILASYGTFPTSDIVQAATQAIQSHSDHEESLEYSAAWVDKNSRYGFVVAPIFGETGKTSLVVLGSPLDPDEQMKGLFTNLLLGNLLTLAIALGGGYWLADRAMRPVQTITHTARNISETDLNSRINLESKDELGELASTFDTMLSRLQAAFERQRQFVADASHELRTPLTIVNLETSRALAARRSPHEYERALSVIQSENDFMSHLVNDLLTLARMDSGQVALEKVPLDLSDVIVEAFERLAPLAARNNVKLETGELPETRMLGDRQSLLQMVSNLIENAIKYTDGDDKRVCIETGVTDGRAWVRVSDNGPGIAPEHLPHLFDRFYRVDKARARDMDEDSKSPTGSGLGLSIIQWIARAHGGEVHVDSTPGNGSRFEVHFEAL